MITESKMAFRRLMERLERVAAWLGGVDVHHLASGGWSWNGLATFFETFEVHLNCVSNERECFLSCFTSCDTAGQIGHVRAK